MSKLGREKILALKKRGLRLKGGYVTVPLTPLGKKRFKSKLRTRR
jgi:hypothetical protein